MDQLGLGIDELNTLHTFEDFTEKLVQEAGLTQEEASVEWSRRQNLPTAAWRQGRSLSNRLRGSTRGL